MNIFGRGRTVIIVNADVRRAQLDRDLHLAQERIAQIESYDGDLTRQDRRILDQLYCEVYAIESALAQM